MTSDAGLMMSLLKRTNPKGNSDRASTTAEITQRFRNDKWTYDQLVPLAKGKYVRVTGWAMLDTQHVGKPTPVRKTRLGNTPSHKVRGLHRNKVRMRHRHRLVKLEDMP